MKTYTVLVGLPASGKTTLVQTLIKNLHLDGIAVVSRDDVLMHVARKINPHMNYSEAWNRLNGKKIDAIMERYFRMLCRSDKYNRIIIDKTHLTIPSRMRTIGFIRSYETNKHIIECVYLSHDDLESMDCILRRTNERKNSGKVVPADVLDKMKESFVPPTEEEGFHELNSFRVIDLNSIPFVEGK